MKANNSDVIFKKNELGNIVLKDFQGNDLDGLIKHTEVFLTDFYNFTLKINKEEFDETKKVYVYLRSKNKLNKRLKELTTYLINAFGEDVDVVSGAEKIKDKIFIIDIFLSK